MRTESKVSVIHRDQIDFGDRRREDYGDLEKLSESIKEKGIIQSLAVWQRPTPLQEGELAYLLLAGGRRYHASALAGVDSLPCRIYDDPALDEILYREIELSENLERKDLSWIEQVQIIKEINDLKVSKYGEKVSKGNQFSTEAPTGWSKRDTAEMLGKSHVSVAQDIKLAEMIEQIPQLKEAKNKDEAQKLFKKMQANAVGELLLQRVQAKQASGSLDIQKQKLIDSYILRDCVEAMRELPANCIDIVEFDPPYAINLKDIKRSQEDAANKDHYNEIDPKDYVPFLRDVFKEAYRIMSEHSWFLCWYAKEPWQEVIYQLLRDAGFSVNRIAGIWAKPNGQTNCPERYLANAYEPFYYASKGSPTIIRQGRSNVFSHNPIAPTKKVHPTERPIELIQDILSTFAWPGARVVVPCLGSGNSLLACSNLKLQAFGFDLPNKQGTSAYKDSFVLKVDSGLPGFFSSLTKASDMTFSPQ